MYYFIGLPIENTQFGIAKLMFFSFCQRVTEQQWASAVTQIDFLFKPSSSFLICFCSCYFSDDFHIKTICLNCSRLSIKVAQKAQNTFSQQQRTTSFLHNSWSLNPSSKITLFSFSVSLLLRDHKRALSPCNIPSRWDSVAARRACRPSRIPETAASRLSTAFLQSDTCKSPNAERQEAKEMRSETKKNKTKRNLERETREDRGAENNHDENSQHTQQQKQSLLRSQFGINISSYKQQQLLPSGA